MGRIPAKIPPFLLVLALPLSAAEKVTYDDQILPLFQQTCLNCHNPDKAKGGLDLSTYSGAMKGGSGGKIAEPGDAGSKLLQVVMQTSEPKMPPEGEKLGSPSIALLRAWIDGGLLENRNSSARKASKPKFDTALKADAGGKPEGPPPMPQDVLLDPPVVAVRASSVHAMVASPWAPLLAITGQRQVLLFDTNTLELAGVLPFPEGDPVSLAFTPDGRYLITGGGVPGKSGLTVTFNVVTGERVLVAGKEFDTVLAADLKPDLSRVATGSPSRLIKLWKAEDGSQLASIKKHTDWVTAVDFSPDGVLLATGDRNGGVWVWESDSGSEFHTLRAHQAGITAVSFRADSNLLATASEDGSVRFWEMNGGSEVKKIDAHPRGVLAFAWSRDGAAITAGRDYAVRLWKPDFSLLREFKDQPDLPVAVAYDAEGKRAFAADYRGIVTGWDVASGNPVGTLNANPPSIEQRLAALKLDLVRLPEALNDAEGAANASRQQLDEGRKRLADADTALAQAKQAQAAAGSAKQQAEARQEQLRPQLAGKQEELAKARAALEGAMKEIEGRKAALAAVDQKIATVSAENDAAAAEVKKLEGELEKARSENRQDALAGLESSVSAQRQKAEAAAHALEDARSERGREDAAMAALETRRQTAGQEATQREAEANALAKEAEALPGAIAEAVKAMAEAEAKIKAQEAAMPGLRDAIAPLEKSAAEALAKVEQQKQRAPQMEAQQRRWQAAAINAESLQARSEAEARTAEVEGATARIEDLKKSVESLQTDLTAAKTEAAADKVAGLEKKLTATLGELDEAKKEVETVQPAAAQSKARAEELRARYQALQQAAK